MNKNAFDLVTNPVEYDRPFFDFPDLAGDLGNPYSFFPLIKRHLENKGFKKESLLFEQLNVLNFHYDEIFNYIDNFLDFDYKKNINNNLNSVVNEDDDFVYLKVNKNVFLNKDIKQPTLFKLSSISYFNDLYQEEDFSQVNCYNRNYLHYINDVALIDLFLTKNKEHNWIDLFHLDNFNGSYLHSTTDIKIFEKILDYMIEENPELTSIMLNGKDSLNQLGVSTFTNQLSSLIYKNNIEKFLSQPKEIDNQIRLFNKIKQVNSSLASDILLIIETHIKNVQFSDKKSHLKINADYFMIALNANINNDIKTNKSFKI